MTGTQRRSGLAQNSETLKFLAEPQEYLLKMDQVLKMPFGLEYVVAVEVGGEKFEACIPAVTVVCQDPPVVSGCFVGTQGENRVIVFAPSSFGTSIWRITEDALAALRYEE